MPPRTPVNSSHAVGLKLFASLVPVHQGTTRVRWRWRLTPGLSLPQSLERRLAKELPGVVSVRINPAACSLALQFDKSRTQPALLEQALLALPAVHLGELQAQRPKQAIKRAGFALSPGADLLVNSALLIASQARLPAIVRTPATAAVAGPFYWRAIKDLFTKGLNSHVLEALAVASSTLGGDRLAANATLFMLSVGEYLEKSIVRRSDDLLKHLLHPEAPSAWVERDGQEVQISAEEVQVGDTVICAAGNLVAVDGTVLSGEATLNEASMTGESVPVVRTRGDSVLAGTVVEEGRVRVYAERVGGSTACARIADYVNHALQVKSGTQLAASRLADKLVPSVLGLAGATGLLSGDWRRAAAVLQADYACALKLATPVAFKSAMYAAGRQGLLFKGADALERLAEADTFVFDKTGTLTTGCMVVTDTLTFDPDFSPSELIDLAASVEEHYFHPLAQAVVEEARRQRGKHFEHEEVRFIAAHGVSSTVQGKRIVIGSRHFVEEDECIPMQQHDAQIQRLMQQGKTLLYIGYDHKLLGIIALRDSLRPNAAETIARLRALGVKRIVMLTGDHEKRASELARTLKLDAWHSQLLPEGKAARLAEMKAEGAKIAFIGDGVNDAPALAGAHVGIAMLRGADLARLTSDIALLEDDVIRLADAKALAISTMRRIRSNYKLTVGANTTILAAAACGALSPIAASVLHNGSTIAILLNALRASTSSKPSMSARPSDISSMRTN